MVVLRRRKSLSPVIDVLDFAAEKYFSKNLRPVTTEGIDVVKTSLIMGFATDINPIPPVHNAVDVAKSSQNWGVFKTVLASTLLDPAPLETGGGVQPLLVC